MPATVSQARARYDRLRKARRCVKCAAGLTELDGVRCLECQSEARRRAGIYQRSRRGRAVVARAMRARREKRKAAGICRDCPVPAVAPHVRCEACHATHKISDARYLDRKEEDRHAV